MNEAQKRELSRLCGGRIRFDVPMSEHTTFRAGGRAEALYEAHEAEELRKALQFLKRESIPYLVCGGGSNLLVRDGGLEGAAIRLTGALADLARDDGQAPNVLLAGGGLSLARLLAFCRREGLGGLEFLAGIPGTVGGAVAMNAGAFGKETSEAVEAASILSPSGETALKTREELAFSYRRLEMQAGSVILQTRFSLEREAPETVSKRIAQNLERRKARQPLGRPSAGSVFKNPPGEFAGRLIERAGLKGETRGGAMISQEHANFIVNRGGAAAEDILALVRLAQERVRQETGLELELEIRVVGKASDEKEGRS